MLALIAGAVEFVGAGAADAVSGVDVATISFGGGAGLWALPVLICADMMFGIGRSDASHRDRSLQRRRRDPMSLATANSPDRATEISPV